VGVGRYSRGPKFAIAAVTYLPGRRDATLAMGRDDREDGESETTLYALLKCQNCP
jgi:hypothetical protein